MSIGIAIYGIDAAPPMQVLDLAQSYFKALGYAITGATFHQRIPEDEDGETLDLVEVSVEQLRDAIQAGRASDFRLYSERPDAQPWFSSVGYSTDAFGSFFAIDIQSGEDFGDALDSHTRFLMDAVQALPCSYAIVYETERVSNAMWYARGENFVTLYADENPVAFSRETPGLYEGQRRYETATLRMVYPRNFLNEHHLVIPVDGMPLAAWIRADPERGQLDQATETLWCWAVPVEGLAAVNAACGKAGALLAWSPPKPMQKRKLP